MVHAPFLRGRFLPLILVSVEPFRLFPIALDLLRIGHFMFRIVRGFGTFPALLFVQRIANVSHHPPS
jgi:hypothetical protein